MIWNGRLAQRNGTQSASVKSEEHAGGIDYAGNSSNPDYRFPLFFSFAGCRWGFVPAAREGGPRKFPARRTFGGGFESIGIV